jgi:hypothetical protein
MTDSKWPREHHPGELCFEEGQELKKDTPEETSVDYYKRSFKELGIVTVKKELPKGEVIAWFKG